MSILTLLITLVAVALIVWLVVGLVRAPMYRFSIIMLAFVLLFTFPGLYLVWTDYSKLGDLLLSIAGVIGLTESYVRKRRELRAITTATSARKDT